MNEIRNVKLIDGRTVCIRHDGGRILSIGNETSRDVSFLDGRGMLAVPALNLMHVHFRVPGAEYKEDWIHGVRAALAGGVATVGDMPNNEPPITTYQAFLEKVRLIGYPGINYRLWFGAMPGNAGEIRKVAGHPLLAGVKMFMGSSTGNLLVERPEDRLKVFEVCVENGLLLAVHAEEEAIIRANLARLARPTMADHSRIRSVEAAVTATRQALDYQADTGCRLLVLHVSTVEEAEMIDTAKDRAQEVYAEACPHHWVHNDSVLEGQRGGLFRTNPPLRPPEHGQRIVELLGQGGVFDLISPDHAPHTREEKMGTGYGVPSGIPGVQEMFPLAWELVHAGKISAERFVELTSANAAQLFGLPNGRLEPGYAADIVLLDPDEETVLRDADMLSKCGWTAYDGMKVHGMPRLVYVGGELKLNRDHHS